MIKGKLLNRNDVPYMCFHCAARYACATGMAKSQSMADFNRIHQWISRRECFAREGEVLLAAYFGSELAGLGGMTIDPAVTGAWRMRRFYVQASFRRLGIGRKLALSLLERSRPLRCQVTVNVGTPDASPFWEVLGFMPDQRNGHTHIFHPWNS